MLVKGIQDMLTKPNSIYLQVNISKYLQIVLSTQQHKCGILFPTIFITVKDRCFQTCILKMVLS